MLSFDYTILSDLIAAIPFFIGYTKPTTYTNMRAFSKALMRKDIYNEEMSEFRLWEDYQEKLKKEQENSLFAEFAGSLVSSAIGFLTGGPAGAKMGWNAGKALGRNLRKADGSYFDAADFLTDNKYSFSGKFNKEKDRLQWKSSLNDIKDIETMQNFTDLFNVGKAAWLGFDTDWSDFNKQEWKDTKWFGKKGKFDQLIDSYKKDRMEDFYKMLGIDSTDKDAKSIVKEQLDNTIETVVTNITENPETIGIGKNAATVVEDIKKEYDDIGVDIEEEINVRKDAALIPEIATEVGGEAAIQLEDAIQKIDLEAMRASEIYRDEFSYALKELPETDIPEGTSLSLDQIKLIAQGGPNIERPVVPVESESLFNEAGRLKEEYKFDEPINLKNIKPEDLSKIDDWVPINELLYGPGGSKESSRYSVDGTNIFDNLTESIIPIEEWYDTAKHPGIKDVINRLSRDEYDENSELWDKMEKYKKGPFDAKQYFDMQNYYDPGGEFAKNMHETYRRDYGPRFWDGTKELDPRDEGPLGKYNPENLAPRTLQGTNQELRDSLNALNSAYTFDIPSFDGFENLSFEQILNEAGLDPFDSNAPYLAAQGIQDAINYWMANPDSIPPAELNIDPAIWNWIQNREVE